MADYNGTFAGLFISAQTTSRATVPGVGTSASANRVLPATSRGLIPLAQPVAGPWVVTNFSTLTTWADWNGLLENGPQQYWFELVWTTPQRVELGNILTTVTVDIELYNSYREESRSFIDAVNNAGAGILFIGLPALPTPIPPNDGAVFQAQISTQGPPTIDGTFDFELDTGFTQIPVTGSRVVMFPFEPENLINETLQFGTDIIISANNTEQRINYRRYPRQILNMRFRVEEGSERRRMKNLLFDWQPRVFGVPIWFEARKLNADLTSGSTTVIVDTAYGDFRVGSLVIIWKNSTEFDAVEIATINANSLILSSPVTNDYSARRALVMPLRVALSDEGINDKVWTNNLEEAQINFTVIDNEAAIGDTAAFDTHNSKVMLDGCNYMNGETLPDNMLRKLDRLDNNVASIVQFSDWDNSQYLTTKTFLGYSLKSMWEVRQLVHALRGSQVSFYMPTFYKDLVVNGDLSSSSFIMDVENDGYTDYIKNREPLTSIWVELVDGTILTRQVTGSAVLDNTTERLTVDVAWPALIPVADVKRASFLRLSRIADDQVKFAHQRIGHSRITMNVGTVR